jgi:hypothetical protein
MQSDLILESIASIAAGAAWWHAGEWRWQRPL